MNVTHTLNHIQSLYNSYKSAPSYSMEVMREKFCTALQIADLLLYENFKAHIVLHDGTISVKEATE